MKKIIAVLFSLISLFFIGCNSSKMNKGEKEIINKSIIANFDYQGHRGCRGLMPENTIAAMLKAIDLGNRNWQQLIY